MSAETISPTPLGIAVRKGAATLLFLASFFVVKPIWHAFDIHGPWRMAFLLIPAAGMLLFFKAVRCGRESGGALNPAVRRYLNRLMGCMLTYLALLVAAQIAREVLHLSGTMLAIIGVLPALPIIGCICVIGRYLVEEQDEYLRMQAARASLIATGLLLVAASVWGFLEQGGVVRHVPASAAFMVWAIGLGAGQFWTKVRGA